MLEIVRAGRLAPMTPGAGIIVDGGVAVEDGRILDVGPFADVRRKTSGPVRDLGPVTLAPGVFNSHTHLEMTHLLGKTVTGQGFVSWMRSLVSQPLYAPQPDKIRAALLRAEQAGSCFFADISTQNASPMAQILASSGLYFVSFQEAFGLGPLTEDEAAFFQTGEARNAVEQCGRGRCAAAGHALYSTSAERLRAAKAADKRRGLPYSLHLAENTDEDEILLTGKNGLLDLMYERGLLKEKFAAPGVRPVPYAASLGLLDAGTLCVHCVTADAADIATIAASGASVCLCPRSNTHIGEGAAPLMAFLAAGANVCLGTDGLCSNADLDPYGELRYLGERGTPLDLCAALALITTNPARYFGLADRLGGLAPGREARFSVVPDAVCKAFSRP